MSLREKQQMSLDTESAAHSGMEGQSRSSHKYLVLQVWCCLLTLSMVGMAAFLATGKTKPAEAVVSTLKPNSVAPTAESLVASSQTSGRTSPSFIQLIKSHDGHSWDLDSPKCESCSLSLHNNTILCNKGSSYLIYAQVTFRKPSGSKSVHLIRKDSPGRKEKLLVEGKFMNGVEGSVWVAKIITLRDGDRVGINITGDVMNDSTFWGAYQLQ